MQNSQHQDYKLLDEAFDVINDPELSFAAKFTQIQTLNNQAKGIESDLFGDVYSALSLIAESTDDRKLIAGAN